MKICPKCRGLYFDQDQQCGNCKIGLLDKDDFNTALGEYYQMSHSQKVANRYNLRYEIVCKYQFPEIYEYDEQKSKQEYESLQRRLQQKRIKKEHLNSEYETLENTGAKKYNRRFNVALLLFLAIGAATIIWFFATIISSPAPNHTYTCSRCGKTFTDSINKKSIAYSGYCEKCHDDVEFLFDVSEALEN